MLDITPRSPSVSARKVSDVAMQDLVPIFFVTDAELEVLKKEKLLLKDEAYTLIMRYKKEHNL